MKALCEDRGERIGKTDPPKVDVHECKSLTATQRAVLLAEAMLRALYAPPGTAGDWEDAVDAAVAWVNDNVGRNETATSVDQVLPIVANRSHINYWDFSDEEN